jgi:integrase
MKGVTLRHDPKRKRPWGVWIEVIIAGKEIRGAKFFATEAQARTAYEAACAEIQALRDEADEETRRWKALAIPELPPAPTGTTLFETLATRWLEEEVRPPRRAAATYRGYKGVLDRHLFPIMRTWPVTDEVMSRKRLKDVLKEQLHAKGLSLSSRVSCQRCLSAFFTWALTELPPKQLQINPALKLASKLRQDDEVHVPLRQAPNPMTRIQVEAFLTWIGEHYPQLWEWFVWLVDEGSRVGEVSAVRWSNLELGRGKAHIAGAFSSSHRWLQRTRGDEDGDGEKDTKTHRTNQYIDLTDRVVEMLPSLKMRNLEAWMARGRPGKEPQHVFLTSRLTPRRPDKLVYTAFREACDALQLVGQTGKPFTIHCLRDTFATLAILEGKLALGWVAIMLGHASEETLKQHYYRWIRLVEENPLRKQQ